MSTQVEDYAKYIKACVSTMADCLHCAEKSSREGLDCTQHCRVNAELCDTTARIMALQNMDVLAKVTPITIETAEKCAEMCEKHQNKHCQSCAQSCRNLCAQLREIQEKMAS